ncbi:hypothetical protein SZ25_00321 [Candidatus Arcanobacter lacustris]|uniref:Uncharacterized protein n=1 Tax=Candidatus Arcanibacter lacustris TaxID=1607817 RepID=A0A0F5MP19_9RICK|nr:hypothetical protein SZ25_00321 [Candidatus Arcanobacter lacustris]
MSDNGLTPSQQCFQDKLLNRKNDLVLQYQKYVIMHNTTSSLISEYKSLDLDKVIDNLYRVTSKITPFGESGKCLFWNKIAQKAATGIFTSYQNEASVSSPLSLVDGMEVNIDGNMVQLNAKDLDLYYLDSNNVNAKVTDMYLDFNSNSYFEIKNPDLITYQADQYNFLELNTTKMFDAIMPVVQTAMIKEVNDCSLNGPISQILDHANNLVLMHSSASDNLAILIPKLECYNTLFNSNLDRSAVEMLPCYNQALIDCNGAAVEAKFLEVEL